jgi:two-component system, chemotaxis family, protein-glutamate methylesterase/glutaminase
MNMNHAAVFVVLHIPTQGPSLLPQSLAGNGVLPAAHAKDSETTSPPNYVAPPNHHLLLEKEWGRRVEGTKGPHRKGKIQGV